MKRNNSKNNMMIYGLIFIVVIILLSLYLNMSCERDDDEQLDKYIKRKLY